MTIARKFEADGSDPRAAANALHAALKAEPTLYSAVADPLVAARCWELIGQIRRADRRAVWTPPNMEHAQREAPDNVRHLANANRTLMEGFPLPDGTRLGDARREDLLKASDFYSKQATNMRHKALFLTAVAGRLKGRKRVRDTLAETDLVALRDGVTDEAA